MKRILTLALCLVLLLGVLPIGAAAAENPFVDVNESDWYYDAVMWAYENGVTTGVDAAHFGPDRTVTRGQAVTFLWRAMGEPEPENAKTPFIDLTADYYKTSVAWAVEQGITKGVDATHFDPDGTCSTMHIITFLYRTLGVGADGWGQEGADWAQQENLLEQTGLTVATDVNCPRAGVVTFLDRTVGDAAVGEKPLPEGMEPVAEDPVAEQSTTVTEDDSAILTVDTVDVTAGTPTELHFELTSSLIVPEFTLSMNGGSTSVRLKDGDADGVYTAAYTVNQAAAVTLRFTAKATVGGKTLESNDVIVMVTTPLSAQTEANIDTVLPTVEGLMQSAADGLSEDATEEERAEARADAIERYLNSQLGYWTEGGADATGTVSQPVWVPGKVDSVERDGYSITYTIGGVHFGAECSKREEGVEGGGAYEQSGGLTLSGGGGDSWYTTTQEKAIVLGHYPKNYDRVMAKSALELVDVLKTAGYNVTERYNFKVSDFMDLEDYAVIIVRSHGDNCRVVTRETVTEANRKTYATALQNNLVDVVTYWDYEETSYGGHSFWNTAYFIRPEYFTHYYKDAGKSLSARWVHFGMCEGMLHDDLADAVVASGADCVTAFKESVYTYYSTAVIRPMLEKLLNGKSVEDAVDEIKAEYGADDRYWAVEDGNGTVNPLHKPSALAYKGDKDERIHDGLYNGSFEAKILYYGARGKLFQYAKPSYAWRWAGAARPVSQLAGYRPDGNYAAYISTGKGAYANESESLICQSILIPENASTLSFEYRVFTEEPGKTVGTPRNDHFYAALVDMNGKTQKMLLNFGVLNYPSLFTNRGELLNAGKATYVMRSWYRMNCDVRAFRGKVVNLCFWVRDANGNAYDTVALIDNITIK